MNRIGSRLRQIRLEQGLTQKEVAEFAGVSKAAISKWESNGGEGISAAAALRLSRAMQVSPYWLVFGEAHSSQTELLPCLAEDIRQIAKKMHRLPKTVRQAIDVMVNAMFPVSGTPPTVGR